MKWSEAELEVIGIDLSPTFTHGWQRYTFPQSPKGTTDEGLQDFRGLPIGRLDRCDLVSSDLSASQSIPNEYGVDIGIFLFACRCADCMFVKGGRYSLLDGVFANCVFQRIKTDRCSLNGLFVGCTFEGTSFRRGNIQGNFRDCKFLNCNLDVDGWGSSSFQDCHFSECRVSPIFSEIEKITSGESPVTFANLQSGKTKSGETVTFFQQRNLIPFQGVESA